MRRDGGTAETAVGREFGRGVRVAYPAWRLRGEVHTHGLVRHTAEALTEWGFCGSVQFGMESEGLMARLRPWWGRGKTMQMRRRQTILDAVPVGMNAHRTELELGYGIPWMDGTARPIMAVAQMPRGTIYRFGSDLRPWDQLTFSLYGLVHAQKTAMENVGVSLREALRN